MAGYTRQDTANNIANGNVIDADDFDAEYNAVENAFNASTGHKHDGTAGEGAPITKVGPSQDLIVSGSNVLPKTTNTLDLGSTGAKFKDSFFDGTVTTDDLAVTGGSVLSGSTTVGGTLGVTGLSTLNSLSLTNNATVGGWINVTDNSVFGGTLGITGNTTVGGTLGVTGNSTFSGTLGVTGNTTVGGTLGVTGNSTIGGTLGVTGQITGDVTGDLTGNADTATALATARTITIDGDVDATATSFDGTGDITLTTTLDTVNSNVGSFGSATAVPVVTVNAKGLVTAVSTSSITTSLTVGADSGTNDAVALASDVLTFAGTTNEIETAVTNNQIQIGLPSNVTIGNNLTVTGDLEVQGTTVTLNTANLDIEDSTVRLAKNATTLSATNGAGIEFGANASKPTLTWDNNNTRLSSNKNFYAPSIYGNNVNGTWIGNNATVSGNYTVDVTGDIYLDADGGQIYLRDAAQNRFTFHTDGTPTLAFTGTGDSHITSNYALDIDVANEITLDSGTGQIYLRDAGSKRGIIDLNTSDTIKFLAGTSDTEEMRVSTSGVSINNGLRVGDTATPTDNNIEATGDIEAGGEIKLTGGAQDWTFEVDGSNRLVIQYDGTSLARIDTSGNLVVAGDVTAFGIL